MVIVSAKRLPSSIFGSSSADGVDSSGQEGVPVEQKIVLILAVDAWDFNEVELDRLALCAYARRSEAEVKRHLAQIRASWGDVAGLLNR